MCFLVTRARNLLLQTDRGEQEDAISEPQGEWHQDRVVKLYHQWMVFDHALRLHLFLHELELGRQDRAP
jgi:hypothetical protein